jgi:putative transposase
MKRHSRAEIIVALNQAQTMMARGQSQSAICKMLGISVMTLHRWRKEFGELQTNPDSAEKADVSDDARRQIADLREENRRLRTIVTDLLLERTEGDELLARYKSTA